jgi:hypothetical protein
LFLPKSVSWTERAGWILGHIEGQFYLALHPIGPYRWESIAEDDHVHGWLLRILGHHIGLVVEAVECDEVVSLQAFGDAVTDGRLDVRDWEADGVVSYRAMNGRLLVMTYDGDHCVDGVPVDYSSWPLYGGPGIDAPLGTGVVVIRHGDEELRLDFDVDENKPMIPMRVIG